MLEIRALTKWFGPARQSGDAAAPGSSQGWGGILAVDRVSFSVAEGEVLGFLGPNGAGKSTTMKMVTGYLPPSDGTAIVCGFDVAEEPLKVKERLGYLPEGAPAYPDMTPESFLNFIANVRGLRGAHRRERLAFAVERTSLAGVMRQPIETLSKGFKRRVGLAQAILHDPDVLIMDEPTDGLDPNQKHEVRDLIRDMARTPGKGGKRKAIILSTHILEEVETVCTRAVVIARGKVVADGSPASLRARSASFNAVTVRLRADNDVSGELKKLPHVASVERVGPGTGDGQAMAFRVTPEDQRSVVADVSALCRSRGWQVEEISVDPGRLDETFRELTKSA
jgi:ABC-2 type transport system ATP-binding protein